MPAKEEGHEALRERLVVIGVVSGLLFAGRPAHATYRGRNGRIAFSLETDAGFQINTIEADSQGLQQITSVTQTR